MFPLPFTFTALGMMLMPLLCAGCTGTGTEVASRREFQTWKWQRDDHVVKQRMDYSCGAAALATIMRYYFEDNVTEQDILTDILKRMSKEDLVDRQTKGLSMLDLQEAAGRRGYQAVGVKLPLDSLPELGGPILVHLETREYRHFAILKGTAEDRIYLADPSRGNMRMPLFRFEKEWSRLALVLGKESFGMPESHGMTVRPAHPVQNEVLAARRAVRDAPL
jgi:predicted double-glycine peptidase